MTQEQATVLVADDDRAVRLVLSQALQAKGYRVIAEESLSLLFPLIEQGIGQVLITDVRMKQEDGLDLLPQVKEKSPNLTIFVISAENSLMTALKSTQKGAFDYLPKPFDLPELLEKVKLAIRQHVSSSHKGSKRLKQRQGEGGQGAGALVGHSQEMQPVFKKISRFSMSFLPVLIQGSTGTGKSSIARLLFKETNHSTSFHLLSPASFRIEGFSLFEGIGQEEKGLCLDEVNRFSLEDQDALLLLLKQKKFKRLVSIASEDLSILVEKGLFRRELYYHLRVLFLKVPDLDKRQEDIPDLIETFLERAEASQGGRKKMTKEAKTFLSQQHWLGHVKELENFIYQLCVLVSHQEIRLLDVKGCFGEIVSAKRTLDEQENIGGLEKWLESEVIKRSRLSGDEDTQEKCYASLRSRFDSVLIDKALKAVGGSQVKASEFLGLNRATIRRKIEESQS